MKILISGGQKTRNIVNGISKKFESSNDQFTVIEFLDNVNEIYSKGDYYDKAVIAEQSITREGTITDEATIRNRINSFAMDCANRGARQSFVFLTQSEYMANIVYEEILPIERNSVVILAEPPYSVGFFHSIIVNDVSQVPSEYVFKPSAIEDANFDNYTDETYEEETESTDTFTPDTVVSDEELFGGDTDFDTDDFGGEADWSGTEFGGDDGFCGGADFGGDTGFGNDTDQFGGNDDMFGNAEDQFGGDQFGGEADWGTEDQFGNTEDQFGNTEDQFGNTEDQFGETNDIFGNTEDQFGGNEGFVEQPVTSGVSLGKGGVSLGKNNEVEVQNNGFGNEDMYDGNNTQGFGNEDMYDGNNTQGFGNEDMYGGNNTQGFGNEDMYGGNANGVLEGFDDEPETSNSSFSDELYGDYTPTDNMFDDDMYNQEPEQISQQFNGTNVGMSNNIEGFDDYGDDNQEIPNNVAMGFDEDMYDEGNNQNSGNQIVPGMMAAGAIAGMGMLANDLGQQSGMQPVNQGQPKGGKKIGPFGKGKQTKGKMNNQQTYQGQPGMIPDVDPGPVSNQPNQAPAPGKVNVNAIKSKLQPFANKGNSIVATGCGGCGTSTIAYSLANILNQLGYSVLLVDFDTEGRTQSYITKSNYESMEPDSANLMSAVNSSTGMGNYTSVVKEGFHLLTMGLGTDTAPVNELIHKEKLSRFVNLAKTSYNFVVYDIPFDSAVGFLSEIVYMADNLVLVTDASNWGITKTMINMCNIASDEMQDTMFHRAQIVFNKYRRLYKVFGKKVKTASDITKMMDNKVFELIGEDIGLHFEDITISGVVNDTPEIEDGWFSDVQYSDTAKGQHVFLKLVEDIVLNR